MRPAQGLAHFRITVHANDSKDEGLRSDLAHVHTTQYPGEFEFPKVPIDLSSKFVVLHLQQ